VADGCLPTIEKYVVMGDDCEECDQDGSGNGPDGGPHLHHVDLWIGRNCIADVAGKVELARCTGAAADRWGFSAAGA
jgi:hypothetical protein